jgi:hypothetical protein
LDFLGTRSANFSGDFTVWLDIQTPPVASFYVLYKGWGTCPIG